MPRRSVPTAMELGDIHDYCRIVAAAKELHDRPETYRSIVSMRKLSIRIAHGEVAAEFFMPHEKDPLDPRNIY